MGIYMMIRTLKYSVSIDNSYLYHYSGYVMKPVFTIKRTGKINLLYMYDSRFIRPFLVQGQTCSKRHTLLKRLSQQKISLLSNFSSAFILACHRRQFGFHRESVASLIVGNILVRQIKPVLKTVFNSGQLHQLKSLVRPHMNMQLVSGFDSDSSLLILFFQSLFFSIIPRQLRLVLSLSLGLRLHRYNHFQKQFGQLHFRTSVHMF